MSITDELRKWGYGFCGDTYDVVTAIADRIDAEYQKAIRELNNLADASVLLPVDADGVPIHIGDVMESKGGVLLFGKASFEVRSMRCDECGWEVYDRLGDRYAPSLLRHHHEPTVEDVLRELVVDWDCAPDGEDKTAVLKEYAKRLTLAESEDA